MFPEGTRSESGDISHFRDGSFKLAAQLNLPILPVVIDGTRDILTKHGRTLKFKASVNVKLLPPVFPQDFGNNHIQMRNFVQSLMKTMLAEMRTVS